MSELDRDGFRLLSYDMELDESEECCDESRESEESRMLESVILPLLFIESDRSLGPVKDDASKSRERLLFRFFLP